MTGYKYEVWADATTNTTLFVTRVTDPNGDVIGEVKALTEYTSLRLAYELKTGDRSRFAAEHGIPG